LAVVRSSGTTKLYVNGALGATVASDTTNYTGTYLGIGGYYSTSYLLNGYMTDLRVVKGTAVYTGTFTPPTAPLATSGAASAASYPSTTNVNTSFASSATSLLCSMTNGGILDNAMISNMETVGNAQISTATAKYGSGSLYFDGNGDWLTFPSDVNSNFAFRTGDFTIEFWAWKPANGVGGYDGVIGADNNGNASGGFAVELSSNRGFVFYNDGFARITYAMNPNDSTWHHYAVVRASGVMALYKDGQQLTTAAYTGDLGATPTLRVGSLSTTSNFNGYLDDLRVTKGVARYTGNFVPPQVSLANQ
jgi:hypothetical protein